MIKVAFWLAVLVVGIGLSLYTLEWQDRGQRVDAHGHRSDESAIPQPLFQVTAAELTAVEIIAGGHLTRFQRNRKGRWFRDDHSEAEGGDGTAHSHGADPDLAEVLDKAFRLLANARYDRIVASGPRLDRAQFGLTYPELTAMVYRHGQAQPLLTLESGDLTPDGFGRYVLVPQLRMIVQLPEYQVSNLRLLAE